jgi:hypothetical protein
MLTITFNGELNCDAVLGQTVVIATSSDQEVCMDLNGVTFARPCGMATLAAWVEHLLRSNYRLIVSADRSPSFKYMQNMNLFSLFNVYPVEQFNRHTQAERFMRMVRVDWQSNVTQIARDMRDSLQVDDRHVRAELFDCLDESISNLWAHAATPGFAVAQSYEQGTAQSGYELAIVDCGKGIRAGLLENPDYRGSIPDDMIAVEMACRKGVSGALYRYPHDQQHFGQGLFRIDTITKSTGGCFRLYSGAACRERCGDIPPAITSTPFWQGTILKLRLTREGLTKPYSSTGISGGLNFG